MMRNEDIENKAKRRVFRRMVISGMLMLCALAVGVWSVTRHQESVLIVTSRPEGAEVVLNGRPTTLITNAFFAGLPADSIIVTVRKDGYRPVPPKQGVRLGPNDTTRVTFILAEIVRGDTRELPNASGRPYRWGWRNVRLNSEPPGAEIYVDDQATGLLTPADFLFEAGPHYLRAHWPNGAKAYTNIHINPAKSQSDVLFRPATYVKPDMPAERQ